MPASIGYRKRFCTEWWRRAPSDHGFASFGSVNRSLELIVKYRAG